VRQPAARLAKAAGVRHWVPLDAGIAHNAARRLSVAFIHVLFNALAINALNAREWQLKMRHLLLYSCQAVCRAVEVNQKCLVHRPAAVAHLQSDVALHQLLNDAGQGVRFPFISKDNSHFVACYAVMKIIEKKSRGKRYNE
jgi:hypothetical protein